MLVLLLLVAAGAGAGAGGEEGARLACSAGSAAPLSVEAAGEPGRYTVRYCRPAPAPPAAAANDGRWEWDLTLKVVNQSREKCSQHLGDRIYGQIHSESLRHFNKSHFLDQNCSHVCLSQDMDLVFHGCYNVYNRLKVGRQVYHSYSTYLYVDSDLTREHFLNHTHSFKPFDHDNKVSFLWETKIPLTVYEIHLCINQTDECADVTERCSRRGRHVLACELSPPAGCHRLSLSHRAPWTVGGFYADVMHVHADFCHSPPSLAAVGDASWAVGGAAAGAGALAACLAAAACWLRRARARHVRKLRTQDAWKDRAAIAAERVAPPAAAGCGARGVLLLHARDCAALERFARVLGDLLRDQLHVQVWDVYSPEVVAATGSAPSAWVLQAVQDPAVPVLLLQTPALQLLAPRAPPRLLLAPAPTVEHFVTPLSYCLLADLCNHSWVPECGRDAYVKTLPPRHFRDECDMLEYNCDHLRVEAPLLGGAGAGAGGARVMHRAPHCADALLTMAMRALADAPAPAPAPAYRKYYIATVSALEVETVRTVVPYRRYVLPGAAPALLRDLAAAPATPPAAPAPDVPDDALFELHAAHRDLLEYVRSNPDFLAQEMMCV